MKNILLAITLLIALRGTAQIQSAELTASGLTCSMCSKAIYKSLEKIHEIKSITVDIKKSSYSITFKEGAIISPDVIKKAVEDAGFSVASLKITANLSKVEASGQIELNGSIYHFVNNNGQGLNGHKILEIVDKNYLSAKEHRKYEKYIVNGTEGKRIYNVTLL